MIGPQRIDQLTREEKRKIQRDLIELGFLDETLPSGDPADDGLWGPVTDAAYQHYWASRPFSIGIPVIAPAPEQPWWVSGTHWSLIGVVLSGLFGLAGWKLDAGELAALLSMAATVVSGLFGMYRNGKRKGPIDPTLLARVGGHDIRLPPRVYNQRMPPDDPRGAFRDY